MVMNATLHRCVGLLCVLIVSGAFIFGNPSFAAPLDMHRRTGNSAATFIKNNVVADSLPGIIPLPSSYKLSDKFSGKYFVLRKSTPILLDQKAAAVITTDLRRQWQALLKENIAGLLGVDLDLPFKGVAGINAVKSDSRIVMRFEDPHGNQSKAVGARQPGSYQLKITPEAAVITAGDVTGFLYGIISLMQLGAHAQDGHQGQGTEGLNIPCWQIKDQPEYNWRGLMLDESRHFFGKAEVEKLLTWMAYYKLNKFHWHLTDEPGWRFEVPGYPELTRIGAVGNKTDATAAPLYYTDAEIKEVVNYAKALGIEVIPEIDMPGHATAANRAYPENSGGGTGKFANFTFNPGRDSTYSFLSNILRESHHIFGSDLVHLGGDEVSFGNGSWGQLPAVRELMAAHHLNGNKAVEAYFLRRMADSALKFNRKILTWDEGVEAGLSPRSTIIFWWRHDKPNALKNAVERGYDVVMCPRIPLYFDFVQDSNHKVGRKWDGKYAPLREVFDFNPPAYIRHMNNKGKILGIQANLWTETVQTVNRLDFMLFPRMAALAAAGWTKPSNRDFIHFESTLKSDLKLYQKAGLYYYNPFDPASSPEPEK